MTLRHIVASYIQWIWGQWGRLSALFVTLAVIASLTVGMARATRRYDALAGRVQAVFHRRDAASTSAPHAHFHAHHDPERDDVERRERAELLRKLDEILARLPDDRGASTAARGPHLSSH
jgi:hypothetical protein